MSTKKQNCPSCNNEFTINTLNKYGGVCGKCKNIKIANSHQAKKKKVFLISVLVGLFLGWIFIQSNPTIIPKKSDNNYFGDRHFADNEFATTAEKNLYDEYASLKNDNLKRESLKKLILLNPHKPIYKSLLESISDKANTENSTSSKPPVKKTNITPDLIKEIESWNFFKRNNFNLSNKWELSPAYYGPGFHMNYSYDSSSSLGMEIQIKDNKIFEGISLSNTSNQIAVELAEIFFKEINRTKFEEYLNANLNRDVNQIKEAKPYPVNGAKIYAGRVGWGNTLSFDFDSDIKVLPKEYELNKEKSFALIKSIVEKSFIDNLDQTLKNEKIGKQYPLLANYKEQYNLLPLTSVFLYYEGLQDGPIYDKPGAKNFGANELGRVSFSNGSVPAKVLAHKELEGGRNYFYVIVNNLQGWMGRPYIMKNKAGDEFFMPNPLTGETARKELGLSDRQVNKIFRAQYDSFIPSYESINWDYRIPERFRREGYDMYVSALQEGYKQHQSLVNSYLSGTW